MSKNNLDLISEIVSKSLNISKNKINPKTNLKQLEEWDSLGMLSVMSALDKKFKGSIKVSSFDKVKTISDIEKLLK
jgi:acyl carrier protein